MKIMIVDDSEVMIRLLEGWLRKWNYDVVVARNGAEAIVNECWCGVFSLLGYPAAVV